jgi:hypothetical protein
MAEPIWGQAEVLVLFAFMLKQALLLIFLCVTAIAQSTQPRDEKPRARSEQAIELWGAASMFTGTMFGATAINTRTMDASFRYRRDMFTRGSFALRYTADVIPMALFRDPYVPGSPKWVYGGGFNPIGLQVVFRRDKKVNPYFGGSGGLLFHTRPVMLSGVQYNFTADWNVGVEIRVRPRNTLSIAFRYQHLSNAERGTFNFGAEHGSVRAGYTLWQSK